MKKLMALLLVFASLSSMAADLELVVNASSPGYVDAKTIDVASITAGDAIIVELWLNNLDFTLAGFEGQFQQPTWMALVDVTAVEGGSPPWASGLAAVQQLPADEFGNDTTTTFRNDQGYARVGAVITDPLQRPTSGNHLLATFRLVMGRDYNSSLTARDLQTCISADETISFLACNTGSAVCHIIADDSAQNVAVNYGAGDLEIALTNSDTTFLKGDANSSGGLTTQDVGTCLQCIVFGDSSTNPNCPLDSTQTTEWNIKLDVNCDGFVTNQDIGPLVRRAIGTNNRPASKRLAFTALDTDGALDLPGGDNAASVVGVTLQVDGKVKFGELVMSQEGITDGWQVSGAHDHASNTYKYIMYNMSGKDLPIPSVQVNYKNLGDAKVAVAGVESYSANGRGVSHAPALIRNLRD
jgi:hypothetical protein